MKILNLLLPTAFLAVLVIGLTLFFTTEDREVSEMENRELQTANFSTSIQDIISGKLTKEVESYISDQFAFRDDWMKTFVKFQSVTGKTVIKDQYYVDARTGWIVSKAAELVPEEELDAFVDVFRKSKKGYPHITSQWHFSRSQQKQRTFVNQAHPLYLKIWESKTMLAFMKS